MLQIGNALPAVDNTLKEKCKGGCRSLVMLIAVLMPAMPMNGCMMGMHMTGDHAHGDSGNRGVAVVTQNSRVVLKLTVPPIVMEQRSEIDVQFHPKDDADGPLSATLVTGYAMEGGERTVLDSSVVSVPGKHRVTITPPVHGPVSITATIIYGDQRLEAAADVEIRHGRSGTRASPAWWMIGGGLMVLMMAVMMAGRYAY